MNVRVRAVLCTDLGTYIEYVTPAMDRAQADLYVDELREEGVIASVVLAETRTLSVREIVPKE